MSDTLIALRAEIEGGEALIKAAAAGQLDLISELLGRNVDVNHADLHGVTPVKAALQNGHLEASAMLLDHGAEVADGGMLSGLRACAIHTAAPGADGDTVASDGTPDAGRSPARPDHLVVDGWRGEVGHDYAAAAPGELSLQEGDFVAIEAQHDDGWWIGTNRRTKQRGHFPGSYVEVHGPMKISVKQVDGAGPPDSGTCESAEDIIAAIDTVKHRVIELKVKHSLDPDLAPKLGHSAQSDDAALSDGQHYGPALSPARSDGRGKDVLSDDAERMPQTARDLAQVAADGSAEVPVLQRHGSRDKLLEQELHDLQLAMQLAVHEDPVQPATAASKARAVAWRSSNAVEERSRQSILAWLQERNSDPAATS